MQKKITLIIISFISSVLFIYTLYLTSKISYFYKNGFNRIFPPHFIKNWKVIDIYKNSYYVAGIDSKSVYLSTPTNPTALLLLDYIQNTKKEIQFRISDTNKIAWRVLKAQVNSPNFYLTEGLTPTILQGELNSLNIKRTPLKDTHFIELIPLSTSSFILKTYDSVLEQNILSKNTLHPTDIKKPPNVLEKQIDGLFCVNGDLHYDDSLSHLVYVYSYRNQFILLDTNLNIIYKGRTIDTVSRAQIKVSELKSGKEKKFVLSSPPLIVNKKSCISNNLLFIQSGLIANNENRNSFYRKSVIDIYNLRNGQYKFSFYLPEYKNKKVSDFIVHDGVLIALYDHYLLSLTIDL